MTIATSQEERIAEEPRLEGPLAQFWRNYRVLSPRHRRSGRLSTDRRGVGPRPRHRTAGHLQSRRAQLHGLQAAARLAGSEWHDVYWLGTDDQGRDMLSAILYGLRTSLGVGAMSAFLALVDRHDRGPDRRILRRQDRRADHAAGRPAAILSVDARGAHPDLDARPGRRQDHRGPGRGAVGLLCAHGAQRRPRRTREGLRHGGALPGPQPHAASCSGI